MRGMLSWMGIIGLVTAAGCGGQAPAASKSDPGAALNALAAEQGAALIGELAARVNGRISWDDYRTPEKMVADASPKVPADFLPPACATTSAMGTVLTLKLNNCTGPGGKVTVSGTFLTAFAPAPAPAMGLLATYSGKLDVTATTGDVSHVAVTTAASALILSASERTQFALTVDGTSVTSDSAWGSGRSASLMGKANVIFVNDCVAADGKITVTAGMSAYGASLTDYKACKGQCATGSMSMTAPMASGSVTWSGTGDIGWQWNGKSGTISVPCGG